MTRDPLALERRAHDPHLAPRDVSETLLELTGQGIMRRDFALFRPNFHLPQHIQSLHGRSLVRTARALEQTFDALCDHFASIRMTELVRLCEAAEAKSPTCVHATHVAHMLSRGTWIKAPYPVFSVLEYIDGRWRVNGSEYAVDANSSHARALHKTGVLLDPPPPLTPAHPGGDLKD